MVLLVVLSGVHRLQGNHAGMELPCWVGPLCWVDTHPQDLMGVAHLRVEKRVGNLLEYLEDSQDGYLGVDRVLWGHYELLGHQGVGPWVRGTILVCKEGTGWVGVGLRYFLQDIQIRIRYLRVGNHLEDSPKIWSILVTFPKYYFICVLTCPPCGGGPPGGPPGYPGYPWGDGYL